MVAEDQGSPSQQSENTATVAVVVQRNDFAPEFRNTESYAATISESLGGGNEVGRVEVVDEDTLEPFNTLTYRVIGDDAAAAFFEVLQDQRIVLRSSADLSSDRETEYSLRVEASDGGTPVKSSTAVVPITVIRNLNAPRFEGENTRASIPDNLPAGSDVVTVVCSRVSVSLCVQTSSNFINTNFVDRFYSLIHYSGSRVRVRVR